MHTRSPLTCAAEYSCVAIVDQVKFQGWGESLWGAFGSMRERFSSSSR